MSSMTREFAGMVTPPTVTSVVVCRERFCAGLS
jgi:hypothetical protein